MTAGRQHHIVSDPSRGFIRITLWGSWYSAQADELAIDHAHVVRAMKMAGVAHGSFITLVDIRDITPSSDVVTRIRSLMTDNPVSRKLAILARANCLPSSRVHEIGSSSRIGIFHIESVATDWLVLPFSGQEPLLNPEDFAAVENFTAAAPARPVREAP